MLSSIEAPYPAVQGIVVHIAGNGYAPGSVPYGAAGTPLVISGKDFGGSGIVQFVSYYKNTGTGAEVAGTPVPAKITSWSEGIVFLTVPSGAQSGLVTVTSDEGKTSNGLPFIVTPGAYAGVCPAFPSKSQLEIITSSLPNGVASQGYSATLSAQGGTPPYTWSLTSGTLPSGLSLNASTGVISGTPTNGAGPLSLTVQATDSRSLDSTAVLGLTVDSPTLTQASVYSYTVPSGGFDHVGNITSSIDSVMGKWGYTYDHLNRLMSGIPSTGAYSGQGESLCLDYDSFGNRTQADLQTTACKPNPTPTVSNSAYDPNNASYNAANQVSFTTVNSASSGFAYDAAGDVTFDGVNYYAYDAEGRVCATQTAPYSGGIVAYGYLYDAEGRRVAKGSINSVPLGQFPSCNLATNGFKTTERYVLGQGGEQLTTLDGNGNWQRTNVYAGGKLIATYDAGTAGQSADAGAAGGLHFQLTDPLGSRRVQTNSAGEAELDCQSLPFGDQLSCFPDPNAPGDDQDEDATGILTGIHFTGKERDAESGLDYFGARYYGSSMGRFLSPDPSGLVYADPNNPQSFNLYSYALNNPLRNTDPTGLYCYYGSTDADVGDNSQYDFNSSQGECEAADENGNKGQWVPDATTTVNVNAQTGDTDISSTFTGNVGTIQYQTMQNFHITGCPSVPTSPSSANLNANMNAASNAAFLPDPFGLLWFRNQVNYGGAWDYKTQGAQYEDFGNFNYGATGASMNLPPFTLDRAAGRAQRGHPSSPQFGGDPGSLPSIFLNPNGGVYPYGDDPNDQKFINLGIKYAQQGCG